jgi:hypothetical protein
LAAAHKRSGPEAAGASSQNHEMSAPLGSWGYNPFLNKWKLSNRTTVDVLILNTAGRSSFFNLNFKRL